jgi:hypothetical protein
MKTEQSVSVASSQSFILLSSEAIMDTFIYLILFIVCVVTAVLSMVEDEWIAFLVCTLLSVTFFCMGVTAFLN